MPKDEYSEPDPLTDFAGGEVDFQAQSASPVEVKGIARIWESLVRLGLGETALRVGTGLISISLFLVVIWVMSRFYVRAEVPQSRQAALAAALPTATPTVAIPVYIPSPEPDFSLGIPRLAMLHTIIPAKPRTDVIKYTVVEGDTIFGISEKFNLRPETILWGNRETLSDNAHFLRPGMELNILPENGVYHKWSAGEGLNGVSGYYGVTPETIINYPGNHLDPNTIGDYANPNIAPGTMLIVPGGKREMVYWANPFISRTNPASARYLGPGSCGTVYDGVVGSGGFVWPSPNHWLSGYDYSPNTGHSGIDIGGTIGVAIYAADHGVIVYSGWNDWGYGNMIVIDHGNGWQTLYAHLSAVYAGCGQSVEQGATIALMGSTGNSSGPHLHFEMSYQNTKVNPWDFLP